ncbi:hypothetical protein [Alicyclobacillus acidoterrestris]|uniref:Uncharacterized protein n=1 Tax=Alicyclobacillus acidoterrestris (strain ATCC 49025 / DSM 3922 / CIP 106132 / NCIMB 13137 / GD3B) TaxID=1356854 RepID=T0BU75_ALIAG|nr:hypothetical protein [Alicyclobacillus acidoterrestris]EPZ47633.1 hypothetical protein N007_05085 [Alicyclobacillus acidoterrestris ATCC 49025]UNO48047.1 hypothetical protein K1I37_15345 [Alicyclobacillus acidoterrestris]
MVKLNLQRFAKDRVLGSSATIALYNTSTGGYVTFAECDSFTATRKSSQKQYQPLGQVGQRTQDIYEGWTLSFGGAIVDHSYDDIVYQIDQSALSGAANMRFRVTETIEYYDGSIETWVYPDTVLYGFEKDISAANSEITWKFTGDAQTRVQG